MMFKHPRRAAVASAMALVALAILPIEALAQTRAALTRDVDRPSAQPVNANCIAFGGAFPKCVLYTVPPGKRLVVEMLSYRVTVEAGFPLERIATGKNTSGNLSPGDPQVYNISFNAAVPLGNIRGYSGSQLIRFYLEENEVLAAQVSPTGGTNYQNFFAFSGYLVDK